jgi:hypothetical protein
MTLVVAEFLGDGVEGSIYFGFSAAQLFECLGVVGADRFEMRVLMTCHKRGPD